MNDTILSNTNYHTSYNLIFLCKSFGITFERKIVLLQDLY